MDAMGNVMPVAQRLKLLQVARRSGCLVLEDDYDSEFRYFTHPVPSLQAGRGAECDLYEHFFQASAALPAPKLYGASHMLDGGI